MIMRVTVVLVSLLSLFLSTEAIAQPPEAGESRNYASVSVGADFTPPDVTAAVEYGERVTPNVQAYVTLTFFDNVIGEDLEDDLAGLSNALTAQTGRSWRFDGRDRGVGFVGGARYLARVSNSVRPYVGAGAGVLNVDRTISERTLGDVTMAVFGDYGIGSPDLALESQTGPLVELIAGITFVPRRRPYVDIGYRFRRAFGLGEDVSFSQVSAGIGYRF